MRGMQNADIADAILTTILSLIHEEEHNRSKQGTFHHAAADAGHPHDTYIPRLFILLISPHSGYSGPQAIHCKGFISLQLRHCRRRRRAAPDQARRSRAP